MDCRRSRDSQHLFQDGQEPGWDTRYRPDIGLGGGFGKARELHLPVGKEGSTLVGHPEEVDQGVDTVNQRRREVADLHAGRQSLKLVGVASPENEILPPEDMAVGTGVEV